MEANMPGLINETILIKALEDSVSIIHFYVGESESQRMIKLNFGEVYYARLSDLTQALKISGKARVYSPYGTIETGELINN